MTTRREDSSAGIARFDPLAGGGEMGQLMRSVDWSKLSIGPVDAWPQSLRTALSILLESHFPMYIAWGRNYTQFYNDGYRPILGSTKHPRAMGLAASETFAESWHIIGPMFDGVMQGSAVGSDNWMLPLDRYGFLEECYFNFSYSPIRDESGAVGGVLVTVSETTARVLGERRLQILQALASRTQGVTTIEAACSVVADVLAESALEIPFALLYLLEDDGTTARLAGSAGVTPGASAGPERVDLGGPHVPWSLDDVARSGVAASLEGVSAEMVSRSGQIEGTIRHVFVLPIARSGESRPAGILVAATSSCLQVDDKYRGFLDLVASQIATTLGGVRALEEARARAEALAEIDRAKTAFFSNVSHEFRTPLTLLLGPTEDALADPSGSAIDAERWRLVHRNALRLLKLVNTLLDFSRIEAGRIDARYELTEIGEYTRELASVFQSAIERAGLRLELQIEPLDDLLYIDHDMWEKVVFNLLSNALKFTFDGRITIVLRREGDAALLVVRDTGVGIPPDELRFLFDRFHRVQGSRARSHEGTGIGLALVRELVRLHGGTVVVESEVDVGTVFTVRIPFGSAHLPEGHLSASTASATSMSAAAFVGEAERWVPETDTDTPAPAVTASPSPARILLVDDNADMRDYVARLLRERWTVDTAADGTSALAMVRDDPPDLILADVMMPGLGGFELLEQLRAEPATRAIPVIFLSARAGEEARVEGLHAGADDYLAKPFSARELTARVATHLELSRLRRDAERAQLRMRTQFMQAPVAVSVVVGPDFVFELANPLYEAMVGRGHLAGKSFREAFPELPDDAPVLGMLEDVYASGLPFHAEEFLVPLDRDGSGALEDVYFKFTSQPLHDGGGRSDGIMTVAVDVTEQVRVRRQLERQTAELDRLNRAKDEFLATLSHELRTPLTSILGWARLLTMETSDAETVRTGLMSIDHSAQIQAELINDVLDLSRITTGKVRIESHVVNVASVASAALDGVRLAARARGIHLENNLAPGPKAPNILGDGNRLQQIIWNLLTNAIKFTPQGGTVELALSTTETSVVLRVTDSGVGISADFLRFVFEPFRQADSSTTRLHGGLGLGLSIVRHLVEMHGGRIAAESEGEGRGATFTAEFPLLESPAEEEVVDANVVAAETEPVETDRFRLSGFSILIIDDQESVYAFLRAALERSGAETRSASSVQEGIRAFEEQVPDIVLCDIAMPHEDGFAFIDWVRSRPGAAAIPVIAITAFGRPEDEERTIAAGFAGYLRKPVDPTELVRVVSAFAPAGNR
jgi:signal transduction histidine kinase/DNA-binding response OmpR family regulator